MGARRVVMIWGVVKWLGQVGTNGLGLFVCVCTRARARVCVCVRARARGGYGACMGGYAPIADTLDTRCDHISVQVCVACWFVVLHVVHRIVAAVKCKRPAHLMRNIELKRAQNRVHESVRQMKVTQHSTAQMGSAELTANESKCGQSTREQHQTQRKFMVTNGTLV